MADSPRRAGFSLEDAVLDIGGDVGALILYTDADYDGREIEISLVDASPERDMHDHAAGHDHAHAHEHEHEHGRRTHTAIHQRRAGGQTTYAGIYPELTAGTYRLWTDDPTLPDRVTIVGGEVAEVDWRKPAG
ncbi:MAG: hypothetical protein ACRDGI_01625 [Candidatus Limnocylindrales bacterium]